ncbi:MAG: cystathionine beta-synthase [Elusimicrobia bacterium]|nr:MAG: cystathionine beta-synthase [Elusimicrobiota bacterium]
MRYENILETIGNTPLVRLNHLAKGLKPRIYVKVEYFNPGGSVKDRIAVSMIDAAEKSGKLKPGGTIIEGTSGNTGIGLALVAAQRGYKLIFTITDKQSREKINFLKALGAEVIVCPTNVEPKDPRSYYSIAEKLVDEIPNAYYPNQYENPVNPQTHYETTGPEIWRDTEGEITHFVAGMGTGGTISGAAKYLKEQNKNIKIIGADPIGSLYYEKIKYGRVGKAEPYVVEGIGEDIFPSTMDLNIVDTCLQVTDKDSFLMTRRMARVEGLFCGGSCGSAVWAGLEIAKKLKKSDYMVIILPDTGMRYLSKIYNEEWMKENQYVEETIRLKVGQIVRMKKPTKSKLIHATPKDSLMTALKKMRDQDISQLPVFEDKKLTGSVFEDDVMGYLLGGKDLKKKIVREAMQASMPVVGLESRVDQVMQMISDGQPAVMVRVSKDKYDIITKYDILNAVSQLAENLN